MTDQKGLNEIFAKKLDESQTMYRRLSDLLRTVKGDMSKLDIGGRADLLNVYSQIRELENERNEIFRQMTDEPKDI